VRGGCDRENGLGKVGLEAGLPELGSPPVIVIERSEVGHKGGGISIGQ